MVGLSGSLALGECRRGCKDQCEKQAHFVFSPGRRTTIYAATSPKSRMWSTRTSRFPGTGKTCQETPDEQTDHGQSDRRLVGGEHHADIPADRGILRTART